jgi:hypothetical protein
VLLILAFLMIMLTRNLPRFYVSSDCFSDVYMRVPEWMLILDHPTGIPCGSIMWSEAEVFKFSFLLMGFLIYLFLRTTGLLSIKTVSVPSSVSPRLLLSQIILGASFIIFSILLLIKLKSNIEGLMSVTAFDEHVMITFTIVGFIVSFFQLSLFFLYGLWILCDGILLMRSRYAVRI